MRHVDQARRRLAGRTDLFVDAIVISVPDDLPHELEPDADGFLPDATRTTVYDGPCMFVAPAPDHGTDEDTGAVRDEMAIDVILPGVVPDVGATATATITTWAQQPQYEGQTALRVDIGHAASHEVARRVSVILERRAG